MPAFKKFVQTGRIARCARGKFKGKLVSIVDIIDQNRVLIDGPLSGVPRQQYPVSHLYLTKFRVKFPYTAPTRVVRKALEAFNLKEKWSSTQWAERAKAKHARVTLTDFDRFKIRTVRRQRNRLVTPVYHKLKKAAARTGFLFGKPVKGTKPLPKKNPDKVKKKKVVKKTKKVAKK
ncbi:large ribosomal subunit protein eL14 [Culicoides brevitarsis]|uniref:large ribosomal subunit protein eL14 n=1 Tax=Culicoides brevitarsis TaxID=469753 RepID=UPI00307B716A